MTPTPSKTPTPTPTLPPTLTPTPDLGPERSEIGYSLLGQPIEVIRFGNGANALIFVGGIHAGFAPGSVTLAEQAVTYFSENLHEVPALVTLYIIPSVNPDSPRAPGQLRGRLNAHGVDLNRNWPCEWSEDASYEGFVIQGLGGSAPLSEPETDSLATFIMQTEPAVVAFWTGGSVSGFVSPGGCGTQSSVSVGLLQTYGSAAGYHMGNFEQLTQQEINGDATNWLDQQGIPSIFVLLPGYKSADWNDNLAAIKAVLDNYSR
ncbi:MAG: M14 family zinc carboxypeptidase [Chloroflexota bacterium]